MPGSATDTEIKTIDENVMSDNVSIEAPPYTKSLRMTYCASVQWYLHLCFLGMTQNKRGLTNFRLDYPLLINKVTVSVLRVENCFRAGT